MYINIKHQNRFDVSLMLMLTSYITKKIDVPNTVRHTSSSFWTGLLLEVCTKNRAATKEIRRIWPIFITIFCLVYSKSYSSKEEQLSGSKMYLLLVIIYRPYYRWISYYYNMSTHCLKKGTNQNVV